MIQGLEYKGELKGKVCAICKLTFGKDNETVFFCENCESLFHQEHLINWLSNHKGCPVCAKDLSKEIEKYSLSEYKNGLTLGNKQIAESAKKSFKLINKDITRQPRFFSIIIMVVGMLVVLLSVVSILLTPFPYVLIGSIIYYGIFIFGMYIIKDAKTNFEKNIDNYWKAITFSEKGIIVDSIDSNTTEILSEDIINIRQKRLNTNEESEPIVGRYKQYYKISLEIITQKQGRYNFNPIFRSTSIAKREQVYQDLHTQIGNLYNLESNQPKTFIQRLLSKISKDRKFLLISGIIFVLLSALLIPISYFLISL